jgi:DNA-binding MarR family transcriptional regulator
MSTRNRKQSELAANQLHSAAIELLRRLRRSDAIGGLNGPRLSALSVIVFAGPVTLGNLADAEQVRPPTMTRIVNALETLELISKKTDEYDGRVILISATLKGKKVLLKARRQRIHRLADRIEALDSEDQAVFSSAIVVMARIIRGV